ncbi:MAG TPA: hypothetical protein VFR68_07455 [Candidatus Dormibacteraeota bacterium]|nr:hypothetical protein [Candidatus Dormibacteraeota bacterium]
MRRPARTAVQERATRTAVQVRRQLALLQGYADLMEGLSPEQNIRILRVIAEKIRELTLALHPFLEQAEQRARHIEDYRQARIRTRRLLTDYRQLLDRLHTTMNEAHAGAVPPVA